MQTKTTHPQLPSYPLLPPVGASQMEFKRNQVNTKQTQRKKKKEQKHYYVLCLFCLSNTYSFDQVEFGAMMSHLV